MRKLLFLVVLGLLAKGTGWSQDRTVSVPFHSVNGMVILDITVDGKPAKLLLDTGAQYSIVRPGLTKESCRNLAPKASVYGSSKFCVARIFLKDRLVKVFATVADVRAASNAEVDGILGEDALLQFSSVRVNYESKMVEFSLS